MIRCDFKIYILSVRESIRSSLSLRESFLLQTFFMMMSNAIFFSFWWIYFKNFDSIKGWTLPDMACLYGIVSGSYGIFTLFFGGARYLSRMIFEGDLDAFLVKPRGLLLQILGTKSLASGWGDVLSAVIMLAYCGYVSIANAPLIILLLLSSTLIILAFAIIMGSLAFWIGDSHALSKQIFEFLLTFSNYPKTIYVGGVKFLLLTIIPSGFIGYMPVDIIRQFSITDLAIILGAASTYMLVAAQIFNYGLRQYTSGNKTGLRV